MKDTVHSKDAKTILEITIWNLGNPFATKFTNVFLENSFTI